MQDLTALDHFYFHPLVYSYSFGAAHPLKPERLRRTLALLAEVAPDVEPQEPELAEEKDLERVHAHDYVNAVHSLSAGDPLPGGLTADYGFASQDNPPFPDMFEAARAYTGGGVAAARAVKGGEPLAFNIGGGLHHAMAARASGFCIFNDVAVSAHILRERFKRVAYIDIDLHHGDGTQAIFADDPSVLTYSIHQSGGTLYPGSGFPGEVAPEKAAVNVPLPPETSGDVWIDAFRTTCLPALERFQPEAIVFQMGCDPHFDDPLGHLRVTVAEWLLAVQEIKALDLPTVAAGGGGYHLDNVPRMWVGATLTLLGQEVPEKIPENLGKEWGLTKFHDDHDPGLKQQGLDEAKAVVDTVVQTVLPRLPAP
jgi:acetoin utilization protein AcuC